MVGFETAIGLLGQVAPRNLARRDQERLLEELAGLGSEAAACCVHAGLVDRAVELFEQGRAVILSQALDTRTDLTTLFENHPVLAARFNSLREELDSADTLRDPLTILEFQDANDRLTAENLKMERWREIADAFDRVVAEIRTLPGFNGFLRPLVVSDLGGIHLTGLV